MSIVAVRRLVLVAWLTACCASLATFPSVQGAYAHGWYPRRCCGGNDCWRVDKIDILPGGDMLMHAGGIEVFVPRHFLQEPSVDGDPHVCAVSIATGVYLPVCVFMPGTT